MKIIHRLLANSSMITANYFLWPLRTVKIKRQLDVEVYIKWLARNKMSVPEWIMSFFSSFNLGCSLKSFLQHSFFYKYKINFWIPRKHFMQQHIAGPLTQRLSWARNEKYLDSPDCSCRFLASLVRRQIERGLNKNKK